MEDKQVTAEQILGEIRSEVRQLCEAHPLYPELETGRSAAGWSQPGMAAEASLEGTRGAPAG